MLSCKQVATLASDYLDKSTSQTLNWKIRMHLLMCSHCRRFIKHLKITKQLTPKNQLLDDKDVDVILEKIKQSAKHASNKNDN
jgi:hypothetical protein